MVVAIVEDSPSEELAANTSMDFIDSDDSNKPTPLGSDLLLKRFKSVWNLTSLGEAEVNNYLGMSNLKPVPGKDGNQVLDWWRLISRGLPGLAKLARKY